jgi:transcription elongation factor GreA
MGDIAREDMTENKTRVIHELLNEEKWTRATLNSYTINNLKELDSIIEETIDDETESEVKQICDEHLQHTKNSIIALYISGIISLKRRLIDDSNLIMLIKIFSDNHKWNIVEFLCNRILQFGENKFALRTLAECYDNENEEDKKFEVWERLVRIDYEEADIVQHIAEKKEAEGLLDEAVENYKKAIYRYINKKLFSNVREIWQKLLEYCPDDLDFFFHVDMKIEKTLNGERAAELLKELYYYYRENEKWTKAIEILKRILDYDSKNNWARDEIVECYRGLYANHSHLEEYLRLSNLSQGWRNVHDAIADFEKHIAFDAGNFVCHRSWGIGMIRDINDDDIVIDFARKRGHSMSLKMAVNALNTLSRDHIWVLKVIMKKEDLRKKVKEDIPWALKTVIKSFDNAADMKKIKAELVPSILTPNEWSSWSTQARKILKTDPNFGNLPDKRDMFTVRENPITLEEKLYNKYKAEKDFFPRLQVLREFIESDESSLDSEYFSELFEYFTTFLKSFNAVNEIIVSSYIFIQDIVKNYPYLNPGFELTFQDLYSQIENIEDVFSKIEDAEIQRKFLQLVKKNTDEWPEIFIKLFPAYLSRYIIDELMENNYKDNVREMFQNIVDNYKDYREPFVWIAKNISTSVLSNKYDIEYEKILIGLIHLLEITFREIDNRREVSQNRKLNRQIQTLLFKEKRVEEFIKTADKDSLNRIFTLINDIKDIDPSIKIGLRKKITDRFPDFKFYGESGMEKAERRLMVTSESYFRKQKELNHILDVEVPRNSKEIGAAMELGDLRENAEYKAAKEKQEMLNNAAGKLKEDLERAFVFEKKDVKTDSVGFGTTVFLKDNQTDKTEEFTILGPWESRPDENVISYLSPLGSELINHKKGENLKFTINERECDYTIEEIRPAEF